MITPVLLCGGSGTRLWPLSRKSYPKQFSPLLGEDSLFQMSANRFQSEQFNAPVVVTANDFRFIVTEQLDQAKVKASHILIEPEGRDTAPAILAAALVLQKSDPNAIMLVAPSDHVIAEDGSFEDAVQRALPGAQTGKIVTFGISPDRPETGYGYLELGDDAQGDSTLVPLKSFVEKPNLETAKKMLSEGRFLWNAGIFMFSVRTIIDAFQVHASELLVAVQDAVDKAQSDLGFTRLDSKAWSQAEAISIDYAVMEKAENLLVAPFNGKWSDLGGLGICLEGNCGGFYCNKRRCDFDRLRKLFVTI